MKNALKLSVLLIFLLSGAGIFAQSQLSGKVVDSLGEPVIGVSVFITENPQSGTITDTEGRFSLIASEKQHLTFSYIGYKTVEIPVGKQTVINITMSEDHALLDEVIVVGYGTQKKSSLTGAISNITSDDLTRTASVTTSGALVGKIAGISARQSDGRPGASTNIQVRNLGTPLYVIDGMPADAGQFNNLSTTDIESISVLKDGSAAIYGIRASNGVVLITTKSGKRGERNTVNASGYVGFQNFSRFPKPGNAGEYVRAVMESDINSGQAARYSLDDLAKWESGEYPGTDYYNAIVSENAPVYYGNINIQGGSEKSSHYLSISHINQESIFKGYNFKRTNIQANMDIDVLKHFTVGTKISGRIEERHNVGVPGLDQDNYWSPYYAMFRNKPTNSMYANNNPNYIGLSPDVEPQYNPASFDRNISGYTDDEWRVLQTNFFIDYKTPVKGLTAKASVTYWFAHHDEDRHEYKWNIYSYNEATDIYTPTETGPGWKRRMSGDVEDFTYLLQLNYQNSWHLHNVSAVLASEMYKRNDKNFIIDGNPTNNYMYKFPLDNLTAIENQIDTYDVFSRSGYVFRVSYDYAGKYFLEAGGRYDGSSLFRESDRWGLFPTASAGWRISEESFLRAAKDSWLTNLKLRASYGITGDDRGTDGGYIVAPYAYLEGYNWGGTSSVLDGKTYTGLATRGLPTTTVSWMKSKMLNIGLDLSVLNDRLSLEIEYFHRRRTGIPATSLNVLLPKETGFDLPQENLNSDSHIGTEGSLIWRDKVNGFNYQIGTNFTFARRRTDHTEADKYRGSSWDNYRNSTTNRWSGINWGYEVTGQFQSVEEIQQCTVDIDGAGNKTLLPGDLIYKDVNGDGVINEYDMRPIGYSSGYNSLPYLNFALNLQAGWKGFDLKADFTGASFQSYLRQYEIKAPLLWNLNNSPAYLLTDTWRHEDPSDPNSAWIAGKYPAIRPSYVDGSSYKTASTFWMTNVNYFKLRTLEVGYTLPKKLTRQVSVENLRFYVNGYNLISFDNMRDLGLDPEIGVDSGLGTPTVRTYNIGFNLTF